jgi:hypothetical protein
MPRRQNPERFPNSGQMRKDAKMEEIEGTRLMIFLALPTFFTDASGLLRVQEHAGIITPPIVQIARTASVFIIQASAKKPH